MKPKKILLWGKDDLLSSSVKLFLVSHQGWEVVIFPPDENFETMIRTVDVVKPNVVLVHQENCAGEPNLLMRLVKNHADMKVIVFDPGKEMVEVYGKQDVLVKSASDLIAVVKANLSDQTREFIELFEMKGGGAN